MRLSGVRGHPRPAALKVNVCFESGWQAEGEISYSGPRADARARLAADTIRERMAGAGRLRVDLIGRCSVFGDDDGRLLAATRARAIRRRAPAGRAAPSRPWRRRSGSNAK